MPNFRHNGTGSSQSKKIIAEAKAIADGKPEAVEGAINRGNRRDSYQKNGKRKPKRKTTSAVLMLVYLMSGRMKTYSNTKSFGAQWRTIPAFAETVLS